MIRESGLPNFHRGLQFLFRSVGESALDELNCALQSHGRGDQHMEVVRHQHIFMQQVSAPAIRLQCFKEQLGPLLILEERPSLPTLRTDKVCVAGSCLLSSRSQIEVPQGLKPRLFIALYGAPKGAPLPKRSLPWREYRTQPQAVTGVLHLKPIRRLRLHMLTRWTHIRHPSGKASACDFLLL